MPAIVVLNNSSNKEKKSFQRHYLQISRVSRYGETLTFLFYQLDSSYIYLGLNHGEIIKKHIYRSLVKCPHNQTYITDLETGIIGRD